jgi:DNA repair protein RecN (Recombination protein N)
MLKRLIVKNYAIIRDLNMEFGEGLAIITGETGAGKSILLGALSLVLGDRADTGVLLSKDEKCVVEAHFNIRGYDLESFFSENEIDYDNNAIMRREINTAGKSRAFINDTPVNLNIMKEIGEKLIDIHSQHQTLLLGTSLFQLRVLDAFANTTDLFRKYSKAFRLYSARKQRYELFAAEADRQRADHDYYTHQLEQLTAARLAEGEQEELEQEQERLSNAGVIKESLVAASNELSGEDISALGLLREARNNLLKIEEWMAAAGELAKRIDLSLVELSDVSYETEKLFASIETDPARLEFVTQRLDTIYSLLQKHRCKDLSELLAKQKEISEMAGLTGDVDDRLSEMKKEMESAYNDAISIASELSVERRQSSAPLGEKIVELLKQLGMPHARFEIRITNLKTPLQSGLDRVEFLFSANKQIEPEELSRIASGGELSRLMLSLKSTLASTSGLPAIVFDEIDSGVSGEVASMVGNILSDMGKSMQVINITHLPQVAARGSYHYHVYKEDGDHSTITRIRLLNKEERLMELARLLSGSTVTEAALRNARELLKDK